MLWYPANLSHHPEHRLLALDVVITAPLYKDLLLCYNKGHVSFALQPWASLPCLGFVEDHGRIRYASESWDPYDERNQIFDSSSAERTLHIRSRMFPSRKIELVSRPCLTRSSYSMDNWPPRIIQTRAIFVVFSLRAPLDYLTLQGLRLCMKHFLVPPRPETLFPSPFSCAVDGL